MQNPPRRAVETSLPCFILLFMKKRTVWRPGQLFNMTKKDQKKIFLGFDFYGAGNVGDDLMLHGFLSAFKKHSPMDINFKFGCIIPHNIDSQRKRFPEIDWCFKKNVKRNHILSNYDYWVGVGDTPFQMTSGTWLLNAILKDIEIIKNDMPMYMFGIGGEKEVLNARDKAERIINNINKIWTRDSFTRDLLITDLNASKEKVSLSSDLANLALEDLFSNNIGDRLPTRYDLAITYYSERKDKNVYKEIETFLKQKANNISVVFVGNETRKGRAFEYDIYRTMFLGLKSLFTKPIVGFYMPDYDNASMEGLVNHFRQYKVVMASRYHTLLTAAWAGCRIVALDRSSKIKALADELHIPLVESPLNYRNLNKGFDNAKEVPKERLVVMANRARNSVSELVCLCR